MSLSRNHLCFWWRRGRVELPVQRKLSRTYYRIIRLFNLARIASTDRVNPSQPINLSPPGIGVRETAPRLFGPQSRSVREKPGWMATYLLGCNHYWFGICFLPPV